jgi:hypothetical protein
LGQMMWGKTTHIMNHGGFYGKKINTKGFFLFFYVCSLRLFSFILLWDSTNINCGLGRYEAKQPMIIV